MTKKRNKKPQKATNIPPISSQILVRPMVRSVNDIGTWRTALRMADNGNRTKLYNLYEDLMIDGYLSDAIEKRIEAVTGSSLAFSIDGKEVDVINDLMDTMKFENLLREIVLSKFWGISVVEVFFTDGFDFKLFPRKHVRPKTKQIALREEDQGGISYAENDMILQFGEEDDLGIILKVAPYIIYKRGGFGDWAQLIEIFGMPQRIGKYSSMDEQSRRALIDAFETAGSAPYLVIPKETEAIQTTHSNSGNGALYNDFRKGCNEEILVTVLGQTMTTTDGSSLAQGKVHLEVQEEKHQADRRFVVRMLNTYFVPLLEKRGYPVKGGKFHYPDEAEELTVEEIMKLSEIIPIPQSYLHEKFNIPVPKNGEPIARREVTPQFTDPDTDPGEDIQNEDRSIYQKLWDFFAGAPQDGALSGKPLILLNEDSRDSKLIDKVSSEKGKLYFDSDLFLSLSGELIKAVRKGNSKKTNLSDISFTYGARDDAFLTAMEMNVFHFSAAKTLAEIQELNKIFRESKDFQEFHTRAKEVAETFNKTWQETECQSALLTAESASNYHRLISKAGLFPYWEYQTVGDDKVRPEHILLDGLILAANDPRWDKIFPPNGWKCRCRVVPRMRHEVAGVDLKAMQKRCDSYFDTSDWKTARAQGWGVNRAKAAEVFSSNQMYIRKFPDKASKLVGDLYYNDYNLDSFSKKRSAAKVPAPMFTGEAASWYEKNSVMKDYLGRKVVLDEKVFSRHTTKKYESVRVPLLDTITEALKSPDEVWLNDYGKTFRNLNFIKFYEDKVINVICEVKSGMVYQVLTWFEIEEDPKIKQKTKQSRRIDPRWRYRRGLLIKK